MIGARDNGGNCGIRNSGEKNLGDFNSGHMNVGDCNSGDSNRGDSNSGSCNFGDMNVGFRNVGDGNTGVSNVGDWNTGCGNRGDRNAGDYNLGDGNCGCFNTEPQKLYMFNKLSDWTQKDWDGSEAKSIMQKLAVEVGIRVEEARQADITVYRSLRAPLTGEEKTKAVNDWWKALDERQREVIKALPNFDAGIFKACTGIDAREEDEDKTYGVTICDAMGQEPEKS